MAEEITAVPAPERSSIAETGSITAHTARGTVHCITIVGQIEGHMELPAQNKTTKYEHLIPQIAAVEQAEDIDGLLVLLNTVGGDVEAGLAIAELIAGMDKPTVSLVLRDRTADRRRRYGHFRPRGAGDRPDRPGRHAVGRARGALRHD